LPVSGPVGIAINPVNNGAWVGDFGSTGGSNSNDLLIAPTGELEAIFDASTTAGSVTSGDQPSLDAVWGRGVSSTASGVPFYYVTVGRGDGGSRGGEV